MSRELNDFGQRFFSLLASKQHNVVVSPLSIYTALGMLALGAKGTSCSLCLLPTFFYFPHIFSNVLSCFMLTPFPSLPLLFLLFPPSSPPFPALRFYTSPFSSYSFKIPNLNHYFLGNTLKEILSTLGFSQADVSFIFQLNNFNSFLLFIFILIISIIC